MGVSNKMGTKSGGVPTCQRHASLDFNATDGNHQSTAKLVFYFQIQMKRRTIFNIGFLKLTAKEIMSKPST